MENGYFNEYGRIIKPLTMLCDLVICMLVYFVFIKASGQWMDCDFRQSAMMNAVLYSMCLLYGGVILHKRAIRPFNVLLVVIQNITLFAIASTFVLHLGDFVTLPLGVSLLFYTVLAMCSVGFRLSLRWLINRIRMSKNRVHNVVLVGSYENNQALYGEMTLSPERGFRVAGYFDFEPNPGFPKECAWLGKPDEVTGYLKQHPEVRELYCCLPSRYRSVIVDIIHYCVSHVVHFYSVPNVYNYMHHRMYYNQLGNVPYLSLFREPLTQVENRIVKRAFDIVVSATFLCTLFPFVYVIVAAITKLTMPGPVFFRQKRTGINGKDFYCIKFRSMKVNADADRVQATKNDPRKTKWGDIMRKTNIDELPQFINVLVGDMSIVGPRPHMLKHTEEYSKLIDKYMVRHYVKPGITGWSQVTGFRGETKELSQMEGRVQGDIWYIEHWSFWLDIYIMHKMVANVIKGDEETYETKGKGKGIPRHHCFWFWGLPFTLWQVRMAAFSL